jgi:hypothetical protein
MATTGTMPQAAMRFTIEVISTLPAADHALAANVVL